MKAPLITFAYLVPLGAMFAVFSLLVVVTRVRNATPFGDGDNTRLRGFVRIHGNFAEWIPMIVLVVAALEISGGSSIQIHGLMGCLLIGRIAHAIGLSQSPLKTPHRIGRAIGGITSLLVLVIATVLLAIKVW